MAISLNDHETRIRALESSSSDNKFDNTEWIQGSIIESRFTQSDDLVKPLTYRYKVFNDVVYLDLGGCINTTNINLPIIQFPNWKYGTCYFRTSGLGDRSGAGEGNNVRIDDNGIMYANTSSASQYHRIIRGVSCYPIDK